MDIIFMDFVLSQQIVILCYVFHDLHDMYIMAIMNWDFIAFLLDIQII